MTDVSATTAPVPVARTGPRPELVVVAVVVVLVLVALLLRVVLDGPDRRVAVDRGGRDNAVLSVDSGADTITVVAGDLGGDLAVATTPDGSRVRPIADLSGDDLRIRTADLHDGDDDGDTNGPADVTVRLNRDVRWDVVIRGGSQRLSLDLRNAHAGRIEVRGGQGSIEARPPRPGGLQTFVVAGGAGDVTIHAPAGVPARVDLSSGAGSVTVDADRRQGLGAGASVQTPTWSGAGDRLEVDATSGVGTLTLDRR
jgi:hypothetical protein